MKKISFTNEDFEKLKDIIELAVSNNREKFGDICVKLFDFIDENSKEDEVVFEIPNAYFYGVFNGDKIENDSYSISKKPKVPVVILKVKV